MVILDERKSDGFVCCFYGFKRIFFKTRHCADGINILDNNIGLLVDCLEETELVFIGID